MHELLTLSLTELCAALRARRASPVELMQAVLGRIDDANPALNAFVCVRER
jgi:Asp-tRNA(Asn)/Glu-tRNA(Gln) amidotransferase A subunit family amidase